MAVKGFPPVSQINASSVITQTPTITSGSAYVSGYQLGGIMTLANALRQNSSCGYGISELIGVTILDSSAQNAPIDIWLFNTSPTITSTDHTAFAMTAANMDAQCIGVVSIGTAYSAAAAVSVSSSQNLNKMLRVIGSQGVPGLVANANNVYAVAVVRGTPTYGSTTALQFQFELFLD